jgi:hypothetical protein
MSVVNAMVEKAESLLFRFGTAPFGMPESIIFLSINLFVEQPENPG